MTETSSGFNETTKTDSFYTKLTILYAPSTKEMPQSKKSLPLSADKPTDVPHANSKFVPVQVVLLASQVHTLTKALGNHFKYPLRLSMFKRCFFHLFQVPKNCLLYQMLLKTSKDKVIMILSSEFLVLRPKTTSYHYFPSKSR
jgi:hypothetical protein